MSRKPDYVEVMLFLANYACSNLNMKEWRGGQHEELLSDIVSKNEDSIDQFAKLRTQANLGGDELDGIEIIMELEEQFNVEIDDGWLGRHEDDPTMGELAELVVSLRK